MWRGLLEPPSADRILDALNGAIDEWKRSSLETFDLAIYLWPSENAIPLFNKDDIWIGMNQYTFQIFGAESRPMVVCLESADRVLVELDGHWTPVFDVLDSLHRARLTDTHMPSYDQLSAFRYRHLSKWWAVNGKSFRFLDLPPEIREAIYSFTFGSVVQPFNTRGSKSRLYSSTFQKQKLSSLLRVSHRVREEASHVLFNHTIFSTQNYRVASKILNKPQPRINIRKLELSLSQDDYLRLFGVKTRLLEGASRPSRAARALRDLELKELRIRIVAPTLFSSGSMDGGCHKVLVDWVLEAAWPFVHGHTVKIVGAVRTKQKVRYEAACREQRECFLLWQRQLVAAGRREGTLNEWDEDVRGIMDEDEDGGVVLDKGTQSIRGWTPGQVAMTTDPPVCACKPRCSKRHWRSVD